MEWLRAAWRWWQRSPVRDVVFAALMTAITVSGSYGEGHPNNPADVIQFHGRTIPHPSAGALILVGLATLTLIWRNRWPLAVLAATTAGVLAYTLLGYVNGAAMVAPAAAVYAVATKVSVRWALAAAAASLAVLLAATSASNPFNSATGGTVVVLPVLMAAACTAGIAVSNRRAFVASIQARADDEAKRLIDEERLRIARELHDVVAHTMSTINVLASAAATVLTDRPDAAAEALASIRTASKNGLRELRAILNVLRQADDADPTAPAPGLGQLDALIAGASQAGLPTTLTVTGEPAVLSAGNDLAAYRIIQESLTNAIRHAGPATAEVTLSYLGDTLRIKITDTGRGVSAPPGAWQAGPGGWQAAPGGGHAAHGGGHAAHGGGHAAHGGGQARAGHGLIGMRERAAAGGGTLLAGPSPGGGFTVTAELPVVAAPGTATGTAPGTATGTVTGAVTGAATEDGGRP